MAFRLWDAIERKFGWLAIPFVYGDVTDDAQGSNCEKWTGGSATQQELKSWGVGGVTMEWTGELGGLNPPNPPVNSNPDDAVRIDNSAGSHRQCRRSKLVYTGVVASANFFFLMTCSLFAVCMTPVMVSKQNKNVILENVFNHIILIVIMIVGSIVKLLFVIFRDRVAVIHGSRLFRGVDRIVYLIGLITFYLSGCIFGSFPSHC